MAFTRNVRKVAQSLNGANGVAKAACKSTGASHTINKSFNISSITDRGVAIITYNFFSAMDGVDHIPTAMADFNGTVGNGLHAYGSNGQSGGSRPTATATDIDVLAYNDTTDAEAGIINFVLHGDLA
jgi:hypothetical protein